jgi:uncharacterized protein (TIGR00299 family) protein
MILFLDCANGVSGDMLVAALLTLAAARGDDPLTGLVRPALTAVGVDPALVASGDVRRGGVAARAFTVADAAGFETFAELIESVRAAALKPSVVEAVVAVARRMAAAEAQVHGDVDEHLHELSGVDTVVDLVSAAVLIDRLSPDTIVASPPALGGGMVRTAHGLVSVPAPAVLALLTGSPVAGGAAAGESLSELTTPTGAALLVHYAATFSAMPAGRIVGVGYGAGQREAPGRPNVLRAILIEPSSGLEGAARALPGPQPEHVLLETNVDDMTSELLAHAADALRAAGALDVWFTSALMKKGRPGVVLHVLAGTADRQRLADAVFAETTSFGLRVLPVARLYADNRREAVVVEGHEIGVRLGYDAGRLVTVSPEYEDVRRVAAAMGRPARAVHEGAQAAARARFGA